jgi:hypothetical protein
VNPALVSGLIFPLGIAISGDRLFVVNGGTDPGTGTIGEYTTSGATVNPALVSGLIFPGAIAVSGDNLFVASLQTGTIGEYTTSGATVNASLISGLNQPGDIAIVSASIPEASSVTLLLLGLTAMFGLESLLRRPA